MSFPDSGQQASGNEFSYCVDSGQAILYVSITDLFPHDLSRGLELKMWAGPRTDKHETKNTAILQR